MKCNFEFEVKCSPITYRNEGGIVFLMSIMELSPSDNTLRDYIKYYVDKRRDFSVFKEVSFCNICVLIQRIKAFSNSEAFVAWLELFTYKMALSPVLCRFTIFQAALFWKKCKEFLESHDPLMSSRLEPHTLAIISPSAFWYHFSINQCKLNSAVYTKNVQRTVTVAKIGDIVETINDVSQRLYTDERSLINPTEEGDIPSIGTGICKRSLNKLIAVAIKARCSSKNLGCFNDSILNNYRTMHESLKRLEKAHAFSNAEMDDFVRLCGSEYSRFSIIHDPRTSERLILDAQGIQVFDQILCDVSDVEIPAKCNRLNSGLDECFICNLMHFSWAYNYLENDFWQCVNKQRPEYGKINMPLYNEFCNRTKKANKTNLELILFKELNVDQFYRHFVIAPTCRLNRCKAVFLNEGIGNIHCLAAFVEILIYKLCQKLQSDCDIDVDSQLIQQLVNQMRQHGLLHNSEVIWEFDGL